jgi:small subunit ribosomal protein S16
MVKIRLTRTGKKHQPHYRIVVVDSKVQRDGKYIEKIGYYNPRTQPPTLKYDKDKLVKWIDNGAQMTDTVHDIFVREGVIEQTEKRKVRIHKMISASKAARRPEEDEEDANEKSPQSSPKEETKQPDQKAQQDTKTSKDKAKEQDKEEDNKDEKTNG